MTPEAAILYVQQRMREMDKTPQQYHFEHIRVTGSPMEILGGYFDRNAYNEIWILLNQQNYYGVFILGDNSAFYSDDENQSGKNEFTGVIRFIKAAATWNLAPESVLGALTLIKPIPFEFIRVLIYE